MVSPEGVEDIETIDDLEFERRTLQAIRRELGLGGLARFLMTHRSGGTDYTRDRHKWLGHLTLEEIATELGIPPQ